MRITLVSHNTPTFAQNGRRLEEPKPRNNQPTSLRFMHNQSSTKNLGRIKGSIAKSCWVHWKFLGMFVSWKFSQYAKQNVELLGYDYFQPRNVSECFGNIFITFADQHEYSDTCILKVWFVRTTSNFLITENFVKTHFPNRSDKSRKRTEPLTFSSLSLTTRLRKDKITKHLHIDRRQSKTKDASTTKVPLYFSLNTKNFYRTVKVFCVFSALHEPCHHYHCSNQLDLQYHTKTKPTCSTGK